MKKSIYLKFIERLEDNSKFRLALSQAKNQKHPEINKLAALAISILEEEFGELQFDRPELEMILAGYMMDGIDGVKFVTEYKAYGISALVLERTDEKELKRLKKEYPGGTLFVISPDVSKESVLDYFRELYKTNYIRALMMDSKKAKRFRQATRAELHNKVYTFWQNQHQNLAELNRKSGHKDYDKIAAVARIMPKELGGPMKTEKLRTIIERVGKRKRL